MKRSPQFVGLLGVLAMLAPLALAQETHVSREGRHLGPSPHGIAGRSQEPESQAGHGLGGGSRHQQAGIDYTLHMRSQASSEQDARRQFEAYKVSAYVKGDTAWVVGEWQGVHRIKVGPARTDDRYGLAGASSRASS